METLRAIKFKKKGGETRAILEVALDEESEVSALQSKILNREEDGLFQNS